MLSTIIAGIIGLCCGTITGITPGLHINLVASFVAAYLIDLQKVFSPFDLAVFLLVISITHTFLDTIPQVFLGVADGSELLTLLPSQRMVLAGKGMTAVVLHTMGALGCLILSLALIPFFIRVFPPVYLVVKPYTWLLLSIVLVLGIIRDRDPNSRFWSAIIILASGSLGLIVLQAMRLQDPLLPMLSGLFGASSLIYALVTKTQLPPQGPPATIDLPPTQSSLAFLSGTFAGGTIALLPGLGPAQAAIVARAFLPRVRTEAFMLLCGGINTVNMALSLVTMQTLGFARNGSFEVMLSILRPTDTQMVLFAGIALLVGGIATVMTLLSACHVANLLCRVDYRTVSACVLLFVTLLVGWQTGLIGLLIYGTSAAMGLVAIMTGAPRHHLMACIIVPVIWVTI